MGHPYFANLQARFSTPPLAKDHVHPKDYFKGTTLAGAPLKRQSARHQADKLQDIKVEPWASGVYIHNWQITVTPRSLRYQQSYSNRNDRPNKYTCNSLH